MKDRRFVILVGLAALTAGSLLCLPTISQDPAYHRFAEPGIRWNVPYFWNVISNGLFVVVALWGIRSLSRPHAFLEQWEREAYRILLAGTALIALGSGYYHLQPDDDSLIWDRLPMTIVFMSLTAITVGERINSTLGRRLLMPLILFGCASVAYWRSFDDLRPYVFVQFFPMLAIPLCWTMFPPRYSGSGGLWGMIGLYVLAKLFESFDHEMAVIVMTGGHPLKHVAAAAALLCYVNTVARRTSRKDQAAAPPSAAHWLGRVMSSGRSVL